MFMFVYIEVTQDITTGVIPLEAVRTPYRKGLTIIWGQFQLYVHYRRQVRTLLLQGQISLVTGYNFSMKHFRKLKLVVSQRVLTSKDNDMSVQ